MKKWLLFSVVFFASFLSHANPLPAAEVFKVEAKQVDPNTFAINWQIKPGYFLYRDRIKLTTSPTSNLQIGTIRFPETLQKTDHQGHTYQIYRNQLSIPVTVLGKQPGESVIKVFFQGCADDGFCYPPETKEIKLTINKNLALTQATFENSLAPAPSQKVVNPLPNNDIEQVFAKHHWSIVILMFFGFGLLLSFTPCILPMVPVLSGIIVGHSKDISTRKAFFLSLSYVVSMSLTYALIGAIVALLGSNLQIAMQSPWVISVFSLIFVLLALSMFGYFELRLPISWQAKLARTTLISKKGGYYIGAAIMGCLSTLILSPCVTAPLIGVLGYIAHSGNILFGSAALFFLSIGMGTPLLLIGTSAGKLLPKAGAWMNSVKVFFGVMLLAIAIYLMERILPTAVSMVLWAGLLVISGLYCGALTRAFSKLAFLRQGVGLMLLVYGLIVLVGASMGNTNPLQPLASLQTSVDSKKMPVTTIKTVQDLEQAIAQAKGKPVMLDFYADWCTSCRVMEATTFKDPRVTKALNDFVVLKIDITANDAHDKAILNQFNVVAPPTFIFFDKEGKEESNLRLVGEASAKEFLEHLAQLRNLS